MVRILARRAQELVHAARHSSRTSFGRANRARKNSPITPSAPPTSSTYSRSPTNRRNSKASPIAGRLRSQAAHEAQRQGPELFRRGRLESLSLTAKSRPTRPSDKEEKENRKSDRPKFSFLPHVIEPSAGADRFTLAVLCEAYAEDEVGGENASDGDAASIRGWRRSRRPFCRW